MASLFRLTLGEFDQFKRVLDSAGFTDDVIRMINKKPAIAGDMLIATRGAATTIRSHRPPRPRRSSRFVQFKQHLNSLAEQKELLIAFNARAGDLAVPGEWLEGLSTSSRHTQSQSLEDLEVFVVWCGTLERTFRYAAALMEFCQGGVWGSGFRTDAQNMRLYARAFAYGEVGVYRARVNLVDNWTPEKERSANEVYSSAGVDPDYLLASVEAIFGYALQKQELIRLQDGSNLPYADCLGIQQGVDFAYVVSFDWGNSLMTVNFNSWNARLQSAVHSAPSLHGIPRKVA